MGDISFPQQSIEQSVPKVGGEYLTNVKGIKAGAGQTIKWNTDGFFVGAEAFDNAPFSVDYAGKIKATSGTFSGDISGSTGTFSGEIKTDDIQDVTYGFYGVFVRQVKTTDFSSNPAILPIYKSDGSSRITTGLLSVYANWYSNSTGRLNFLPGINNSTGTSYWSIQKNGSSQYEIRHLGGNQGSELPSPGYVIYTCLFNSNETTYY